MTEKCKRIVSFLLLTAMLCTLLPTAIVQASEGNTPIANAETIETIGDDAYIEADSIFDLIGEMENAPAKKNASDAQLSEAAEDIVRSSDGYVQDSLVRNGDSFTWTMDNGVRCVYSPRMRKIEQEMTAPDTLAQDGAFNEPVATKGGWPSGNQVYLIGPYYGYDSDFTDQYKNEATAIAKAIGDTDGYTLYSGKGATVDAVAEAISKGAVVIFDSHGDTDYASGDDYVTGATNSYLCLKSTTGLTTADYNDGALYYSTGIYINGATIANHMTSDSPNGILWMAICLGMATDTFSTPLREKGVEVVCGYSQSVTFAGDYLYEETFWDEMYGGATVAAAAAEMKAQWGNWDWSTKIASYYGYSDGYATISAARSDYAAFPVIVSGEDPHPGQRKGTTNYGADSLQTVKSTYTLFSQYDISVTVNNSAFGSVSVNGNTVTAVPAEGYFAQSCTLLSGSATITQNGNVFTIKADSDCSVQVNFAPKTVVNISFSGANATAITGYAGDSLDLPTVTAPDGFTFLGWMDAPLTDKTDVKPAHYTTIYTPTADTTLYALYSYVDADSGTGTGDYVKVTSARPDWSGEYLIVYESDGLILDGSLTSYDKQYNYQSVSISNNTIKGSDGDPYRFTISAVSEGYSLLGIGGKYLGSLTDANTMTTGSSAMSNTISMGADGNVNIIGSGGAYLRYNVSAARFRYYKSSTYSSQKAVALYLKDGSAGTVYYTGSARSCDHANTQAVAGKPAGCIESGYTEGVFCNDCQSYIEGHQVIQPLGHSYSAQVVPPTATEQGYTVYTCAACGDTYNDDFVDALGQTFTVSFVVPAGVSAIGNMSCNKTGITLPEAGVPAIAEGYQFVGWASRQIDNVTQMPQLYTGHYIAAQNQTLYAVYSYTEGGSGSVDYVLKDLVDISATDSVVITVDYNGTVYAMNNTNGSSDAPDGILVDVTTENGITKLVDLPDDSLIWNISGTEDAFTIYPNGKTDQWLYCKSTNNGVRIGSDNSANKFSIHSGYLYNNAQSRYLGVYRTNPDWRCYTTNTGNIVDQTLGFYVRGEQGTTYYTTEIIVECEHDYQAVVTAPTCGADGYTTYTCSACGDSYTANTVPATGEHSAVYTYNDGTHTVICNLCGKTVTLSGTDEYKINSAYLTLASDVSVIFRATIPAGFENAYMVFNVNGVEYTAYSMGQDAQGRDLFSYPGINPQMMGDNINAVLYATVDGMEVTPAKTVNYSVLTYCNKQLPTAGKNFKTLISDLLTYGAASQIKLGYKTDALVTDLATTALTPSTFPGASAITNQQAAIGDKNSVADVTGVGLNLSNQVVCKFGFTITDTDLSKYTIKIVIGSKETLINASECYSENGKYWINYCDYSASQFDETITVTLWDGSTQMGRTFTYSVNSYFAKNANSSDAGLAGLVQAVYNYGASAAAYVANPNG